MMCLDSFAFGDKRYYVRHMPPDVSMNQWREAVKGSGVVGGVAVAGAYKKKD